MWEKLKRVKLLALDVDGVLTDGRTWLDSNGQWKRLFSVKDGVGIKRLIEKKYQIAFITGAKAEDVRMRAQWLGVQHFYEGAGDKWPSYLDLKEKTKMGSDEIAYMGDEIFDIPILKDVAFAATVPEAFAEIKDVCQFVSQYPGGRGAVREVCELIFKNGFYQ